MFIRNLEEVVRPHLGKYHIFVGYTLERLLAKGENYGSIIYKVDVKVKNEDGDEKSLHLIAKATPPRCWIWELFTTEVTFKKEEIFYHTITVMVEDFLDELNLPGYLDIYAKYYGSRVTLKPNSDVVDEDAVLVLENLKVKGFGGGDRFTGFSWNVSKAIINSLARQHAVFIAFRDARPKEFEQKILPVLEAKYQLVLTDEMIKQIVKSNIITLKTAGYHLIEEYEDRLYELFKHRVVTHYKPAPENVFNTFCHHDMWTNNILYKVENNLSIHVKLVDLQVSEYNVGTNDLIFFLYTSVELGILREKMDYLIDYYYDSFIESLTKLKVDTSKFTREAFDETVYTASQVQISHVLTLLPPIFTIKGKAKELQDFKPEDFQSKTIDQHINYVPRLHFVLNDCISRNWL